MDQTFIEKFPHDGVNHPKSEIFDKLVFLHGFVENDLTVMYKTFVTASLISLDNAEARTLCFLQFSQIGTSLQRPIGFDYL